jgi:tRNA A-37 threonylcarbamoyl transferase component Bud32/nucleotide-binding universal stress UspA family protein
MSTLIHPGDTVDGFAIEGCLHAGGNGYIYRVLPPAGRDPGFPLLMKVPGVGRGEPTIGLVSFEVEQLIMARLTGLHVPRVVAIGNDPRRPYLVLEEILGEGLPAVVARAPLAADEVARIGAAIADAVHSVHLQHVVHLDLKPENCILRADGTAVLLDFGFSCHRHLPDLLAEEETFAAGSAAYVSPEQLRSTRSELRSDVFALGVMLYELATGAQPFGEPATYAGMRDRLWRLPPPPRSIVPAIPQWLQEVILHCLENDADRRTQSAAHVAFDLRHPEQVELTKRAEWAAPAGFGRQLRSWWRASRRVAAANPAANGASAVILVAVDTEHPDDARHPALQRATRAMVANLPEFRLMFVSAIRAAPLGEGPRLEDTASGKHLEHRNRLRAWADPLKLPHARTSFHVIESAHPAATILELARANHVDLIVIGAPNAAERRLAWWRSVASEVTAGARCSVHVVRVTLTAASSANTGENPLDAPS